MNLTECVSRQIRSPRGLHSKEHYTTRVQSCDGYAYQMLHSEVSLAKPALSINSDVEENEKEFRVSFIYVCRRCVLATEGEIYVEAFYI